MAKSSNTYSKQDSFALQAKKLGYRSRAALKLKEISDKDRLLKRGSRVLDLGCSPGGWSQLCSEIVGKEGLVVGIDLKKVEPIKGVTLIQEDIVNFSKDLLLEYGIKANIVTTIKSHIKIFLIISLIIFSYCENIKLT